MSDVTIEEQGAATPPALSSLLGRCSEVLAIAAIATMLISVNYEVIARALFGHATIWVTEISTYLVVAITFIGAAAVAAKNGNVRVDLILGQLSPKARDALEPALVWAATILTQITLWKVAQFWLENYEGGTRSWSLLSTPLWIPQASALVGLTVLAVVLATQSHKSTKHAIPQLAACLPALAGVALALASGLELWSVQLSVVETVLAFALLTLISALLVNGFRTLIAMVSVFAPALLVFWGLADATLAMRSIGLVAVLFYLLLTGLPVAFTLLGVGIMAILFWLPIVSLTYIGERAWNAVNTFELAAIPMFVLMGSILVRSNASSEMFYAAKLAMGRVRGSLAHASVLASGIFAAVSGSSLATAATMGRVAGPEMIEEKYKPELAYGVLAAGGTLGILIPPSIAMIIYGPLAGVPVTALFVAGVLPGLMMILAFMLVVVIWSTIDKDAAPKGHSATLKEKLVAVKGVAPFIILMIMILGSLYAGIATPTEAGAVGVLGALLISVARGTLTAKEFMLSLSEAVYTTAFLLLIAVGAAIMGFSLDFLSMPQALVSFIASFDLSDLGLFLAIVLLYLVLGMFVEPISMVLITLPVILPVIEAAGWDPLWFGVVLVMLIEIGLITPPVGMILYVLSGVAGRAVTLGSIAKGSTPFVLVYILMVFVFFAFPDLVLFLPNLMGK